MSKNPNERKTRARIVIADDHALVAELVRRLLEPEFDVVETVSDGRSLVRVALASKPDVIVVDIAMPVLNGLDAARQIKKQLPLTKLVFLTMNPDIEVAAEAFRSGAAAYLLKTCAAGEIVTAIRKVLEGQTYVSHSMLKENLDFLLTGANRVSEPASTPLTERQTKVLQLIARGLTMREMATILNVTTRTVAYHKYRIMEVLGVQTNGELVRYALRKGILSSTTG